VGELQSHVDAPVILAGDLTLAQHDQRFPRRQVGARRLVEQAVELIADARERRRVSMASCGSVGTSAALFARGIRTFLR
jgi:hypothetical protein